nr:citramalate synthase [bacterium]
MPGKVLIYDTTLRDGAQGPGISFSIDDKLEIVRRLDRFGVDYIEAGIPDATPKDTEFFREIAARQLSHARIAAMGFTRRPHLSAGEDAGVEALLRCGAPVLSIVGKASLYHVDTVLHVTPQENLAMISDTIAYLKSFGCQVFFDAEHYFDGFKNNPEYALACLEAAHQAGADYLVLCDTNGGSLVGEIVRGTQAALQRFGPHIAIHAHNDSGLAIAASLEGVAAGAGMVQGTINGYGERCGNADLCAVIPALHFKMGCPLSCQDSMPYLTRLSHVVGEIANQSVRADAPYVGDNAFAHKAGTHIDGVMKQSATFEHLSPGLIGNHRQLRVGESAGKSAVLPLVRRFLPGATRDDPDVLRVVETIKSREMAGWHYEGAEASLLLLVARTLGAVRDHFDAADLRVVSGGNWDDGQSDMAMIKVCASGRQELTAAQGDGPVNAVDRAMRKALAVFYPKLDDLHLSDYKVRVLDHGSDARVRVQMTSTAYGHSFGTVGVSANILQASYMALVDAIEYFLGGFADGTEGS